MHIDAIEVYYATLPLIYPWRTAYGEDTHVHSVIVRMESAGYEGWGESCPFYAPTYSSETATSAFFLVSELFAGELVGQDIATAHELLARLNQFKGNPFAKAAIESAWWLLYAAILGEPLHRLWGGEERNVDAGADFGVQDSYDMLLKNIQVAVDRGFKRVKLKVRRGWDLEVLRIVRSTFPRLRMHIDCNGGYSLSDVDFFKAIDELDLAMIEQPLFHQDLFDHAELQRQIRTPICLDESVTSTRGLELALRLGSCKVLNIKYSRVGGLSVAVRLHDIARDAGIPCWVGSMLESGIGAGINIELATLPNFTYPNDLFESRRFYHQDLTDPEVHMNADCTFTPSAMPGTPYKPVIERLARVAKHKQVIGKRA
jgi:O-succinylbenzoate synthase